MLQFYKLIWGQIVDTGVMLFYLMYATYASILCTVTFESLSFLHKLHLFLIVIYNFILCYDLN